MRRDLAFVVVMSVAACKASKQDWIKQFEPAVVTALCEPQQYFRKCFEIDDTGCRTAMGRHVHTCLLENDPSIPDQLDQADGRRWGGEIGACAGTAYEEELSAKRRHDARCDDPNAWSGDSAP